jgi:WD40 repeat protein
LFAQWGNGNVYQVIYTPDGNFMIAGHSTGLFFYNTKDYSIAKVVKTTEPVFSIAIAPDGKRVAAAIFDQVILYNIDDLSIMTTINISTRNMTFSHDGASLATAVNSDPDNYVELWNIDNGESIKRFDSHDFISEIHFSSDGNFLVAGGNSTKIWSLDGAMTDKQGPYVSGGYSPSLSFFPQENLVAEGTDANVIHVWKILENGRMVIYKTILLTDYPIGGSLSVSPDGKWLAAGTTKGLLIWQTDIWRLTHKLNTEYSWYSSIAWSPNSKDLISSSNERGLEVWDVESGNLKNSLFQIGGTLDALAWSPSEDKIAVKTHEGFAYLLQTEIGISNRKIEKWFADQLTFSPDGQKLATGSRVWLTDGTLFKEIGGSYYGATSTTFSPSGTIFAAGGNISDDYTLEGVQIWSSKDWDNWSLSKTITIGKGNDYMILDLALAAQQNLIAVAYTDRTEHYYKDAIKVFNSNDESLMQLLELTGSEHRVFIETISFSPDEKFFVSLSSEGNYSIPGERKYKIRIWRSSGWELLETIDIIPTEQRKGNLRNYKDAISWSPDGSIFAIGVPDGTIQIRRADNGDLLQTVSAHNLWVAGVAFSPDGRYLASISIDGTVKLWGVK